MGARVVASIVGARPQFIKAAPVTRALAGRFDEVLIHTGQHYDRGMSARFFEELQIPEPQYNLGVGSSPHSTQTGKMLIELGKILAAVRPSIVVVYGDTNSTLAGALAAVQAGIPVAHVEAGLRSFNRRMPEETNRIISDRIASFLFCPTPRAVENLGHEGITQGVHLVGDVMKDALDYNLAVARGRSQILARLGVRPREYVLATVHRAANTDDPDRLRRLLAAFGGLPSRIVLPLHPRTRKMMDEHSLVCPANTFLIEPLGYLDSLVLQENADCILTDSGGIQKEAYMLGVRCITLREETEWIETVEAGWNRLAGVEGRLILDAFRSWHPSGPRPALYGDGRAANRISDVLHQELT